VPARRASLLLLVAAAVPLALFLARERSIAGASGFPLDDSFIHLQFARNLAEGAGFSYNPGVPVAGSTAPLWTLLLGGAFTVFGPSMLVAKLVGVSATLAAAFATRSAALAWGASSLAALAAGVALLWSGALAWGALSGMEVSLAALLVASALWAHASDRTLLTAVLAALAALARPEALVLVPLLAISRPSTRRLALFAVVAAVVIAPFVVFSLRTVGTPVPATAAAKVEGGLLGWLAGVREPLWTLAVSRPWTFTVEWAHWLWTTHWLLPIALAPALVVAAWRRGPALAVPAVALVIHPLAMAWLAPYRGPGFQEGRYSIHLVPLAMIVLAVALGPRLGGARKLAIGGYLALALIALLPAATRYGWAVQNINAMQVHLGHWVAARVPPNAKIALNDVGAIAFVSRREIFDLMGLVTPEILPYRRLGEPGVIRFVAERCPDYVIVFPTWFPEMTARRDLLEPVYAVRLERNEVSGGPEMVVYRLLRCTV
jgi:hypothetical protein